jgi:DNA modification methylase
MQKKTKNCNSLSGKEWLKNSISIWSGLRKTPEEKAIKHPASFPLVLVERLLDSFTNDDDLVVLDPFVGIGSTIIQAVKSNKYGIGFDIYDEYLEIAKNRMKQTSLFDNHNAQYSFVLDNAINIPKHLDSDSVDIVITSPPYWNILNQKRTADGKESRNYGENPIDLGLINSYNEFMQQLSEVFATLTSVLKKDKYCIINVMDIRKGPKFFPIHSDLPILLSNYGFELDDIIIWDRSQEYNNLRPLGYPSVFRINKIHEYLLILINRRE